MLLIHERRCSAEPHKPNFPTRVLSSVTGISGYAKAHPWRFDFPHRNPGAALLKLIRNRLVEALAQRLIVFSWRASRVLLLQILIEPGDGLLQAIDLMLGFEEHVAFASIDDQFGGHAKRF